VQVVVEDDVAHDIDGEPGERLLDGLHGAGVGELAQLVVEDGRVVDDRRYQRHQVAQGEAWAEEPPCPLPLLPFREEHAPLPRDVADVVPIQVVLGQGK
jgi:hypothetical protein